MKKSSLIVLASALFICGCSAVSLVYRNADWYLQHKINGYTTFDPAQKETIRKEVSDYMAWHRKVALPDYIIFLQNLNGVAQYDSQLSTEQIALLRAHLLDLYQKSLVPAIRPTARLLSGLNSRQIEELRDHLAEENLKQKHEELDIGHDEYLDKRADKTISFLEWLAGNLSREQEQQVREMSRHLPVVNHIYIQQRVANQARLLALLNEHAGANRIAASMSAWLLTPEAGRTAQQQRVIQSFDTASDAMVAQIHGLLTKRQKEHIRKLISSYIEEMHKFSSDTHASNSTSRRGLSSGLFTAG